MATLQKIRNLSGLLIVVIGVALLSFIVGDFLNSGSTFLQMSRNNVAKVNGTAISPEEFEQKLAQLGPNVTDATSSVPATRINVPRAGVLVIPPQIEPREFRTFNFNPFAGSILAPIIHP